MPSPRYFFGLEGSAKFLRAAADTQGEVMEPFFDGSDWEYAPEFFDRVLALNHPRQPIAFGAEDLFGIVVGFIGTCFAKKIFDEVYDRLAKRPIAEQLDKLFRKVDIPSGKKIEYRDVIYLEDIDLVVVVRALVDKVAIRELQMQIMQAHRVAHSYIEQHGRRAPIHCHKIVEGVVSLKPEFFHSLEEIKLHDRAKLKTFPRVKRLA